MGCHLVGLAPAPPMRVYREYFLRIARGTTACHGSRERPRAMDCYRSVERGLSIDQWKPNSPFRPTKRCARMPPSRLEAPSRIAKSFELRDAVFGGGGPWSRPAATEVLDCGE